MSDVLDKLNPLYTDIANLLGELAGNEAYLATVESYFPTTLTQEGPFDQPTDTQMFWGEFQVPGTYGFTLTHAFWGSIPKQGAVTPNQTEKDITQAAQQAWQQAYDVYSAATGNADSFRDWGQNVWEPDASTMLSNSRCLGYFAHWLQSQLAAKSGWTAPGTPGAPTWLTNLQHHWPRTSLASDSFFKFWDDVNDKCALYLDAAQRLAAGAMQATATVSDFQTNLLEVTQRTKDHVVLALKQWQEWKMPSGVWGTGKFNDNSDLKVILGGVSYGAGCVAAIPIAAAVAGTVSIVTGGLSYLIPDQVEIMQATSAAKAFDIWYGYYQDVGMVCERMKDALDKVQTEGVEGTSLASESISLHSYAATAKASHRDWSPLPVSL